jgi:hypothetical protein
MFHKYLELCNAIDQLYAVTDVIALEEQAVQLSKQISKSGLGNADKRALRSRLAQYRTAGRMKPGRKGAL